MCISLLYCSINQLEKILNISQFSTRYLKEKEKERDKEEGRKEKDREMF